MVALNQQFAVLATFCSLAAMSIFPLSADAAAIQQRASVDNGGPGRHGSPAAPFSAANHKFLKRALPWSPINKVLHLADITIGSAKRHHYEDAVNVHVHDVADIIADKRHGYEAQAHFHQIRDTEAHVSHRDLAKRRSSVIIPSNRGGSYVVYPGRRSLHAGQGKTAKRQEKKGGVPGRINIMSPTQGSPQGIKIASICMQSSTNGTYILNACDKDFTPVELVNASPGVSSFSTSSGQDSEVSVFIQIPLFDPSQPNIVPYCATINGKAASTEPQPMTVEKCSDRDQGSSTSQMFAYNGKTGIIRPMWYTGEDGSKSNDSSTPNNAGTAGVTNVIGRRDDAGKPVSAQNVTLVFVSDAPEVANAEEDIVTATSTMTTTITVTSMSTVTSSASAADVDPTSTVASVTSSRVPSSSAVPSSTSKSPMITSTPVASAAAFNVQVVGLNSTSSSYPTVASTMLTSNSTVPTTSVAAQDFSSSSAVAPTTITSTSTTPTASINAADVAASIAASDASSSAARTSTVIVEVTSSAAVPTAAAVESPMTSEAASSSVPTMTPISTAPYQMVFKADSRL